MNLHTVIVLIVAAVVIYVGAKWAFKDGWNKRPQIPEIDIQNQQIEKEQKK